MQATPLRLPGIWANAFPSRSIGIVRWTIRRKKPAHISYWIFSKANPDSQAGNSMSDKDERPAKTTAPEIARRSFLVGAAVVPAIGAVSGAAAQTPGPAAPARSV